MIINYKEIDNELFEKYINDKITEKEEKMRTKLKEWREIEFNINLSKSKK